jgi:hypothetical protein
MDTSYRTICLVLALVGTCFLLQGCMDVEYQLEIKADGTESIICKVGMPTILGVQSGEIAASLEDLGYKVSFETWGDKHFVIGKKTFPKGKWLLPYPTRFVQEEIHFEPSYVDLLIFKKYSIKAQYVLDKNGTGDFFSDKIGSQITENIRIPFKYVISIPGKIHRNNADESIGNRLVWKYTIRPNEKVDIEVTSYDINYSAVIIVLVVIAGAGLIIFKSLKRKGMTERRFS